LGSLFLFVGLGLVDHLSLDNLNFFGQESSDDSASDALVTNFTTINSRDRLDGSGEVSVFRGSDVGDTVNLSITTGFSTFLVLDDLLDVLGNESTTGGFNLSDLVGSGVVRATSSVGDSLSHFKI